MAQRGIPVGKNRYQVTLTVDHVERWQSLAEKLKLPKSQMSSMLDDLLINTVQQMEKFVKKGKVTMADLFSVIAESLEELEEVEKDDAKKVSTVKKTKSKRQTA